MSTITNLDVTFLSSIGVSWGDLIIPQKQRPSALKYRDAFAAAQAARPFATKEPELVTIAVPDFGDAEVWLVDGGVPEVGGYGWIELDKRGWCGGPGLIHVHGFMADGHMKVRTLGLKEGLPAGRARVGVTSVRSGDVKVSALVPGTCKREEIPLRLATGLGAFYNL